LTFWFEPGRRALWYATNESFDEEIRQRFLATYEAAHSGQLDAWRETPHSLLALIVVLDQFPRNMFRGSARAFAADEQAAGLTREGIEKGFDQALEGAQRDFFTMPLMHSETLADHELLVALGRGADRYARGHRETIARFGRFPYRNEALGRQSTPEETAWLASRRTS
ncbi:MAG TPA: DUF924 family protein, partial [Rhizomicrobium sp.]